MDGTLDVGFADIISAIHAIQGGEPLVLLAPTAIYDSKHPITVLIAPKARPLHTGADMNGKKLSVPSPTGLGAVAVLNWIDKHGGDSKTISFVTGLPFGDIVAALNDGRVDAAEMSEPIKTEIAPQTSVVASTFDDIAPTFVVGVFVAQKAWVRDNPALARSFTSAMSQAALWANSHHADTAKILAEHYQISPAVLTTMVRATFPEHLTADLIQPVVDVAARYGICLPVDATTLLTK
jgi:ABC-type nitrate/sulfonate/bicarbonate transport system substrate-binding protein